MENENVVDKWIRERKSTFVNGLAEGGKINDAIIEKIIENATWAPSHGLVQAWHFMIYAGMGVERFFKVQQEIYRQTTHPDKFRQEKYGKYAAKSSRVSHVIAVIVKRDPKKRFPRQEDIVSVACAVQNIYLSLNSYGIGGYLSTGDLCYTKEMSEFLGLGEEDACLGFFILGIPDTSLKRPERKRIPADEKSKWIRD
jgi:nitroreductase